jgi:tetratricopeptide (TPR) repeat protein
MSAGLAEGEVLLGRFTLLRALDPEGASHVWVAEDADLAERVVLRILEPDLAADRGRQERMRAACRRARRLGHPHIVPVFDFHRDGDTCFISRGYIEGGNLSSLRGRLPSEIAATLMPVLDAVAYAHAEGVVHGNLGVTKILVDREGKARIADFLVAGALVDAVHPVAAATDDSARWMAEDVGALAQLWRELTDGAPSLQPEAPRDLAALRRILAEAGHTPIPSIAGTPPEAPRLPEKLAAPIRLGEASGAEISQWPSSRDRAWMGAAFIALLAVAIGVVFWLPGWVAPKSGPEEAPTAGAPAASQPAAEDPGDDGEATRLLAELLGRRDGLLQRDVERWGAEEIGEVQAGIAAGEKAQLASKPTQAVEHYRQALAGLATLEAEAEERLSGALDSGAAALDAQDATEAIRQYEIALAIDSGNADATIGLERARGLDRARSLMSVGARHETDGDLEAARAAYAEAAGAAPDWEPAVQALDRVQTGLAETEYERRIAGTVSALAKNDLTTARQQVEAALALRPASSEARDLRRRVDQRALTVAIAQGRRRAEAFEAKEEWRSAAEQYQKVLELDKALAFAQEGFDRSDRLASISEKFDAWIARPELLYDARVSAEARELLDLAREIESPGPRMRTRIEEVSSLQRIASTPVRVTFESDGLTEVKIQRVGALGAFERREVPLKPGTYVITGIRRGFRDVRRSLTVEPGGPPQSVVVRCMEKI